MPPGHNKKRRTSKSGAISLDDDDLSSSTSASFSSTLTVDPAISHLCRKFLALSREISKLPAGCYTSHRGSSEVFEIGQVNRGGDAGDGEGSIPRVEVVQRTETCRKIRNVAESAMQDIRNEMGKRRQDFEDLNKDIGVLEAKLRKGEEGGDDILAQLRRVLLVQGQHTRRIQELEQLEEVEVVVEVDRVCSRAEVQIGDVEESTCKERRKVPLWEYCLYVLGGQDADEEELNTVERLDTRGKRWFTAAPMMLKRDSCAAVELNGHTYVMGGTDGMGACYSEVEKYDPKSHTWEMVPPMISKRAVAAAAVFQGNIYVIGGWDGKPATRLSSVEKYDPVLRKWIMTEPLLQNRGCCASVVLNGALYVLGGFDGVNSFMSSVERYDAGKKKWELVKPMTVKRKACSAVVLNGYIYVMGGLNKENDAGPKQEENTLSLVERFDLKSNTWEPVGSMVYPRSYCAAAVLNGHIYVSGGQDNDGSILSSVERYDPSRDKWKVVEPMTGARWGHAMCTGVLSHL
eukprot:gb/GEZN01002120.1/.p1 GENE.gb/GEZN01002120.1/~~gb/GEZN01002120.1/.p1  ORF type:complete len:517 (+),score=71.32 gb/GEZN01002120.1/:70-1620(+)